MNKKYAYTSLRQFSWSGNKDKTKSEKLVEETVLEWYDAKHPKPSKTEIEFINSIRVSSCPFCNAGITKNGFRKDGYQTYKCTKCHKRFIALTGTIFDNHKIPISEWIEYLTHLFEFHSIKSSSFDNRNTSTTGRYWLKKVFEVLKNIQKEVVLDGTIYFDETYLPVIENKKVTKEGKELKGISKNQLCIATAYNGRQSLLFYLRKGKPTDKSILRYFKNHIKEEAVLIHDGEHSHNILVDELALKSIVHDTKKTKKLKDKDNPLKPINDFHSLFKRFMRSHGGYNRSDIQDWLNLFFFIVNAPEDKNDKIRIFLEKAVKNRTILRYRDAIKKK